MFIKPSTETYVIFSPMEGVLMKDGQPLPNTKIIRTLRWNDNDDGLTETFTTDEQGRFSLPIHEEDLTLGVLTQFVAKTQLHVEKIEDSQLIWYNSKMTPEIHSETGGELFQLSCDLDNEEIPVYLNESVIATILTKCRWVNMPQPD